MGDIQLSLYERRGALEVEIIRAKGLLVKPGAKTLPGIDCFICWCNLFLWPVFGSFYTLKPYC